jgi:hypothetical protein
MGVLRGNRNEVIIYYTNEPLVVEQPYQLIELPEINKSSAADEPENREKANWMQVRETAAAAGPLFKAASRASYII